MAYNKNTKTKRKINKLIFSYCTHPFPDPGSTHRDPEPCLLYTSPEIFHPEQKIPVAGHGLAVVFKEGVMELADPRQDVPFVSIPLSL